LDQPRRKRRRSRGGLGPAPSRSTGIMGRISGRQELERAKLKRYDPYSYESNSTQLKWLLVALAAWSVIALALAWQHRATASLLEDFSDQGLVSVPPARFSADEILKFAVKENISCNSDQEIARLTPECTRLIEAQAEYGGVKDTASILFVLLMITLLANIFAFASFTHRASRNLLTLKNHGQGFNPERAAFWFFIPVFNLFKPWLVYRELFRGSDPNVSTQDEKAWKTKGTVPAVVNVWAVVWIAVFLYNSITIGRIWNAVGVTVDDVVIAHQRLIIADFLLVVLGVSAMIVAMELHRRQEARHALVGDVTVTPPPPVDGLEEALKEGIRRKELENKKSRQRESTRRDER
jgi:hypothetical protein